MKLTHKDKEFHWLDKAKAAFKALKAIFIQGLVLTFFTPNKKIRIKTNSSNYAIGAVFS